MGCGLVDVSVLTTKKQQDAALKKFKIFIDDKGLDFNVQFFNNYRYTIFVPTNSAVLNAIANGLPTWEEIDEDYHSHLKQEVDDEGNPVFDDDNEPKYTEELATLEDSLRIAAKITYLTNFVRYHFADNSVFADRTVLKPNEMVTSSYDKELELFCKIHVDRVNNGSGGTSMTGITINASSAAVIHSIDGCLNHVALDSDGRHDGTWKTPQSSRRYLKRYAIRDIH